MPFSSTDVMEERIRFVVEALKRRGSFAGLCRQYGVSRPTGYRWLSRYLEVGSFALLGERSRRPKASPSRTSPEHEEAAIRLRGKYGWGARKLKVLLEREGIGLSEATINRILSRNGLVRDRDRHKPAVKRFERAKPNELWQMDFKGPYGKCYPLAIIDDHSRYSLGLYALGSTGAQGVYGSLVGTFESYGLPVAMLMDHGVPWWSTTNAHGLTWLSVALIRQGIDVLYGAVRHPQTQGKVERFNRTLSGAVIHHGRRSGLCDWQGFFDEFRHDYNHVRPHEALDMEVPAQRYEASAREYRSKVREWEYPAGSVVSRLNSQGCVGYLGRRYFVSEALACQRVRLEEVEDKLLVSYRHMYVREIDVALGTTRALVAPKARRPKCNACPDR